MKKLLLCTTIFTGVLAGQLNADYLDADSEYQKDLYEQESWSEDLSNRFLQLPNSFACIISNSGADVNPNTEGWTALIDEVECGLELRNDNKNAVTYSKAMMSSQRASNNVPQDGLAWFNALNGDRYIASISMRKSADELGPFGSWYFSFRRAYEADDYSNEQTNENTTDYGFVDIGAVGEDVEIKTAQAYAGQEDDGYGEGSQRALVRFIQGKSENSVFIGESFDKWTPTGGQTDERYSAIAGATSATHYYRVLLEGDETNPTIVSNSEMCYSREDRFTTAHELQLYDVSTGEKVDLESGFDFTLNSTTDSPTQGYFSRWGVWTDGNTILFSPQKVSIAATKYDGSEFTLRWSPGKLEQESYLTETLADGDVFETYLYMDGNQNLIDADVYMQWDASNSRFNYVGRDDENLIGVMTTPPWEIWMWSKSKRTSVKWSGGNSIKIRQAKNVLWNDTFANAEYTTFYSKSDWNNWTDPNLLPVTLTEFDTNDSENFWDPDDANNSGTNGRQQTYHLTGSSPGGGYEAHTLYLDNGDNVLSSGDKPMRFDFGFSNAQNEVMSFADGNVSDYEFDPYEQNWPHSSVELILKSDVGGSSTCTNSGTTDYSGCDVYRWDTGAMPWDNSIAAYDSDGNRIKLDDEIVFQTTYNVSDDRNNGITIGQLSSMDINAPIPGCSVETNSKGNPYLSCTDVSVEAADGEKFLLEYDGKSLRGLPGMYVCDTADCSSQGGYWMSLLNLKDGTKLTSTEGKEYVALAKATSVQFLEVDDSACSEIAFDSLAAIGLDDSTQYPKLERNSVDYPLPQVLWDDQPKTSACTVKMGDTSDCTSEQGVVVCNYF